MSVKILDGYGYSEGILHPPAEFAMPNYVLILQDRMMEELHSKGTTLQDIANCLIKLPLSPKIINAIKSAYASGYTYTLFYQFGFYIHPLFFRKFFLKKTPNCC